MHKRLLKCKGIIPNNFPVENGRHPSHEDGFPSSEDENMRKSGYYLKIKRKLASSEVSNER